jgi:hypothetical protein
MGAGYHGGFGYTSGASFRIGIPVVPTSKTLEMALNPVYYSNVIAKKFNIHLKGSGKRIEIIFDDKLAPGQYGRTFKNDPYKIYVGRDAFSSEEQLANTIAHELRHARDYIKKGKTAEKGAYKSGNSLAAYIRGER